MEKLTKRFTRFEGKEKDYSITEDFRILGTEKKVIDLIADYCELNEDSVFNVYQNEELKGSVSSEDFRKEKVEISFSSLMKKVEKVEIIESLVKPLKQNENDNALVIVANRQVNLYC